VATTHLLTGIADLGVQVFDVDDMMNLRQSRDAVGGRSVITGNVEPVEVVLKSTPGQIRDAGREAYEQPAFYQFFGQDLACQEVL